jgi:putative flippase GtrA
MALLRQGSTFLLVGALQLLLDWSVFVGMTALGVGPAPANIVGRTMGAVLGFWLNGRFTFAADGVARLGWRRFSRFVALWTLITVISTVLITMIEHQLGLQQAWVAKPLVEAMLAVVSFFLWRHVVYR